MTKIFLCLLHNQIQCNGLNRKKKKKREQTNCLKNIGNVKIVTVLVSCLEHRFCLGTNWWWKVNPFGMMKNLFTWWLKDTKDCSTEVSEWRCLKLKYFTTFLQLIVSHWNWGKHSSGLLVKTSLTSTFRRCNKEQQSANIRHCSWKSLQQQRYKTTHGTKANAHKWHTSHAAGIGMTVLLWPTSFSHTLATVLRH